MAEITYHKRSAQSTRMAVNQQCAGGRVLEDNRTAKQLMPDKTMQRVEEEEEPLQGKFDSAQRVEDEEEPLQGKFASEAPAQLEQQAPAKPNNTGLPDNLKSGIENLSGMSMDHVKIHYNSSQPAQLNALAYAQGSDIHVAPGQEQHLPHEAWHVVQQAQGRVKPTMQMKGGVPVNDNKGLEHEADVMGGRALSINSGNTMNNLCSLSSDSVVMQQKGRIDLSGISEEIKKATIKEEIRKLKENRRHLKKEATKRWVNEHHPTDLPTQNNKNLGIKLKGDVLIRNKETNTQNKLLNQNRDETYNNEIMNIRKTYEESIATLATEKKLPVISGDAYYGKETVSGSKIFKRSPQEDGESDEKSGKEYVKDMRGTFVPRYVRRELNQRDDISKDLKPTGIDTYGGLDTNKKVHDIVGQNPEDKISWPHREFMQQSRGGGGNQFAFSHTSTKRPILSNDHESFGEHPNGAIITDLSKLNTEKFAAQWQIDPTTGHKVSLDETKHAVLGSEADFKQRDKTVRMSGYRNMEIVSDSVLKDSIVDMGGKLDKNDPTYETDKKESYQEGESKRGQYMTKKRRELESK